MIHVGIDLGTTHSALAVSDASGTRVVPIRQLVGLDTYDALPLLPSALHAPLGAEDVAGSTAGGHYVVGRYAERRALELPARSIVSAKSWLSNANVTREDPILPWGHPETAVPRLSPIDASAQVLTHLVYNTQNELGPAREWDVTLTVPASFDEVARTLTVRAATQAGLHVRLLEEPIAAFGDRLEQGAVVDVDTVLVVDVGGGTADFSLLQHTGGAQFERVASGSHLLLGGDNVDLALAHVLEPRLGEELTPLRFAELLLACRAAKERLLDADAPESLTVALAARGAKLVASTKSATLTREEVRALVEQGFLPEVAADARPVQKSALRSFGLPYERDTAITRHLAWFLRRHAEHVPDAVFFNGGFFRGHGLAERVQAQLASWLGHPLRLLTNDAPDIAVARGAAIFGRRRAEGSARIVARASKSQWIRVAASEHDENVPSEKAQDVALCVLPKGTADGIKVQNARILKVLRGQPVRFDLQSDEHVGEVRAWDPEADTAHVVATLPGSGECEVSIEAERTPLGLLELRLRERAGDREHQLAFDVRALRKARTSLPKAVIDHGGELLRAAFHKDAEPRKVKDLLRELERKLGERASWSGDTLRSLADALIELRGARRLGADHERVYWNLLGYTLRPGRGAPGDEARVREVQKLYEQKLSFPDKSQNWQSFFIAWRRIASGLSPELQRSIAEELAASVLPGRKPKKKGRIYELGREEMCELLSSLEYASRDFRSALGGELAERSYVALSARTMTDLGRLGARTPFYAPVSEALPPAVIEGWMEALLRARWESSTPFREAALSMARLTGDRTRDLNQATRDAVKKKLIASGTPELVCRPLDEVHDIAAAATLAFYGDALPIGLRL